MNAIICLADPSASIVLCINIKRLAITFSVGVANFLRICNAPAD